MFNKAIKKSDLLIFFLALILGLIVISPQLQVSKLAPFDYDETLNWARDSSVLTALKNSLTEKYRFIPVRYMTRYVQYHVFAAEARPYYFMNGIELGLIVFIAFKLLQNQNILKILFFCVSLLILPQVAAGFYRIGTAEPLFTIFLLSCMYFLKNEKLIPYTISLVLFLLSKENSLFVAPVLIVYSYSVFKNKRNFTTSILVYLILLLSVVRSYLSIGGERYFSQYSVDPANLMLNFGNYFSNDWPVFFLLIFSSVSIIINLRYIRQDTLLFYIFLGWTSLIPLLLYYQSYYLLPTLVVALLAFLYAVDVFRLDVIRFSIFIISIVSLFVLTQSNKSLEIALSWHERLVGDSALTGYLISQRENAGQKTYFLINKSLQNINGSWLVISDFGKDSVNFAPSANSAWDAYQKWGENGIDQLVDKTRENYAPMQNNVLIENPCTDSQQSNVKLTPLCNSSFVFREPVCNWCIIE